MFDLFDPSKIFIVGVVALIVIGPKELPRVMRTVGQVVGRMRRMASEFQNQFNEAMREAELEDVRKELASMEDAAKVDVDVSFNPETLTQHDNVKAIETEAPSTVEGKPAETAANGSAEPKPAGETEPKTAAAHNAGTALMTPLANPPARQAELAAGAAGEERAP
jgi:sec-independent protein translocase protein TatB